MIFFARNDRFGRCFPSIENTDKHKSASHVRWLREPRQFALDVFIDLPLGEVRGHADSILDGIRIG